jgi:hypothetical protein
MLYFWTISIVLFLSKTFSCFCLETQHFGDWILFRFYLKTEIESSLQNIVFLNKKRMVF